jgi:hypothetical protein
MEGVGEAAGVWPGRESGHETRPGLARHVDERTNEQTNERNGREKRKGPGSSQGVSLIVTPASLVIIVS